MAEMNVEHRKRRAWPWLVGLVLIIIVLWVLIRGMGPEDAADLDRELSRTRRVPVPTGSRAT